LPCVAASNRTPTNKTYANTLADFTPLQPPMVPAILIHCVKEIEDRGLNEVGIYRIPGNEAEANDLLEKFNRSSAKGSVAPLLAKNDVHAVARSISNVNFINSCFNSISFFLQLLEEVSPLPEGAHHSAQPLEDVCRRRKQPRHYRRRDRSLPGKQTR
jgi:hypothetical protein